MKKSFFYLLLKIKQAQINKAIFILQKKSKTCKYFLDILWENGLILGYCLNNSIEYKIFLKYFNKKPSINFIKFLPNLKKSFCVSQLWQLKKKNVIVIFSTNRGIKSLYECIKLNIGGKALFLIF
jgi:ribosomal protein S8